MALDIYDELVALIETLGEQGLPYAVCGGIAVALHGYPRLTRDIDLLVLASDLDDLRAAIRPLGYTLDAGALPFDAGTEREREVHRISKAVDDQILTLDLVVVNRPLESVWRTRERFDWNGRELSVVSREGLATMKRLAGRAQDVADLENLGLDGEPDDA